MPDKPCETAAQDAAPTAHEFPEADRCPACGFDRANAIHQPVSICKPCYNPREHHEFVEPKVCHSCGQRMPTPARR